MYLIVKGDHLAVNLGPDHAVADLAVDGVCKVDGGRTDRQVNQVAAGRKDKDFVVKKVDFKGRHEVLGVGGCRLDFKELAHPFEFPVERILLGHAPLVFPVGRDAELRRAVHIPSADLNLKGHAFGTDDGGMNALIHVGFRGRNIVFELAGNGAPHVVDDAQHIVAFLDCVDDDSNCVKVINFGQRLVLLIHFIIDTVNMLYAAFDFGPRKLRADALLELFHDAV
ncbi:hypothetical protein SDC9_110762 [bioreactor metagenome]|uniref:Uncharacterized protein n=1 Tax=bioreactor metagenome TaxID=1076179 RepID=A0A645BFN4_9ZZZZ